MVPGGVGGRVALPGSGRQGVASEATVSDRTRYRLVESRHGYAVEQWVQHGTSLRREDDLWGWMPIKGAQDEEDGLLILAKLQAEQARKEAATAEFRAKWGGDIRVVAGDDEPAKRRGR